MNPQRLTVTLNLDDGAPPGDSLTDRASRELLQRYRQVLQEQRLAWTEHHRFIRLLGRGSHGCVFLSEGRGADDFSLPVALKIFSPERYPDFTCYDESMRRLARVASRIASIQQDNVLHVHHWIDPGWVRVLEMEWVDGFDLKRLLTRSMLETLRCRVTPDRWRAINEVVVTEGPVHARLKPGVAIAVIRDCLAALDALHRAGIVHGDVKPSNVMLKRTGDAKLIDIGSAFLVECPPALQSCTPLYAAPEALERYVWTPQTDLASLGYMLIEMLSGVPLFEGENTIEALWQAKRRLPQQLPELLPKDVVRNELLMGFCRRLIAADPADRFGSAEEADLAEQGAAGFLRQLVKSDLASEYDSEIRRWLADLGDLPLAAKLSPFDPE